MAVRPPSTPPGPMPPDERSWGTRFLRGWVRSPLRTGAVVPSSRALGAAMAAELPAAALAPGDSVVVELGPGTGVVTKALLERGVCPTRLIALEYSADFCACLRARFPDVCILQGDAFEPGAAFEAQLGGRPVAAVVSSLPLMARLDGDRERAVAQHLARLAPGAPFIQFTYSPTLPVRPERIGARVEAGRWVKRNLPPARVLVYRQA